jgi:hypothetical protein
MTPLETFENIFSEQVYLIQAMRSESSIHDPIAKTFTLTYSYNKADVLSVITNMQTTLDTYIDRHMTPEIEDGVLRDCIQWLRVNIEQLQQFYNMLED